MTCLFFISLQYGCHTAAAAAPHGEGENAWLQCPLVAAAVTCVVETCGELLNKEKLVHRGAAMPEVVLSVKKKDKKKNDVIVSSFAQKHIFKEHISGCLIRLQFTMLLTWAELLGESKGILSKPNLHAMFGFLLSTFCPNESLIALLWGWEDRR